MQYQDGHISTCFNKKILMIYIVHMLVPVTRHSLFIYLCSLFIINRSFILFIVQLFVLFSFSSILCLFVVQKRKGTILILDRVPRISILCYLFKYPLLYLTYHHHRFESINITQQTPPTLSLYRSEGPITIIDTVG